MFPQPKIRGVLQMAGHVLSTLFSYLYPDAFSLGIMRLWTWCLLVPSWIVNFESKVLSLVCKLGEK